MKLKEIFLLVLLIINTNFFAQSYTPIDSADYLKRKAFLVSFKEKNQALIKSLNNDYTGKTYRELTKLYTDFFASLEKEVNNKDYVFNSNFDLEINNIIVELKKKNLQIPQQFNVLIAKDNMPNAFCLPEGTFVVNMGLFYWLENKDQMAAVVSHELAHYILKHSVKNYIRIIESNEKNKQTVSEINTNPFNINENAFNVLKNQLYKSKETQRKYEMQADSLGYVLYKNSNFKNTEYIFALENLNKFDSISPKALNTETYKKLYDLPNQPFKERWMKKEDFSLYNYNLYKEKLDKDSLLNHPEMVKRIAVLKTQFPELQNNKDQEKKADQNFLNLQKIQLMEILPNFNHSEDYGVGIYTAMHFLQDQIEENYNKQWLGKFFNKIYEARKNYTLNRYLDRVDPKNQNESYQQFLNFMWNLNLEEIKNIADFYNKSPN